MLKKGKMAAGGNERGIPDRYKTQMGTIISDSSHFAAFDRSFLLRQVTVITTGFLPCFQLSFTRQKRSP